MIAKDYYLADAKSLARSLLGKLLVHETEDGIASGIIVETEAYSGVVDKGSHSYNNKKTQRTSILFSEGGHAYVYAIYGMHFCFNVVANRVNIPEAVFIRALEPCLGIELMKQRRGREDLLELCNGPGKLCAALGIKKAQYGQDLCSSPLRIEPYSDVSDSEVYVSPRINIDFADECKEYLWRYYLDGNKFVSKVKSKYKGQPYISER